MLEFVINLLPLLYLLFLGFILCNFSIVELFHALNYPIVYVFIVAYIILAFILPKVDLVCIKDKNGGKK